MATFQPFDRKGGDCGALKQMNQRAYRNISNFCKEYTNLVLLHITWKSGKLKGKITAYTAVFFSSDL
jgi:hypothetical protein